MRIILAARGQHIMKGICRFAVESCGYLCILFPAERKLALAATKVSAKFKCIFLKKIIVKTEYPFVKTAQLLATFVSIEGKIILLI